MTEHEPMAWDEMLEKRKERNRVIRFIYRIIRGEVEI